MKIVVVDLKCHSALVYWREDVICGCHTSWLTMASLIKEMRFPAYKKDIINQAKHSASTSPTTATDSDTIALFESLNGYIQYRDLYHVQ
jgi:hypothetical protein